MTRNMMLGLGVLGAAAIVAVTVLRRRSSSSGPSSGTAGAAFPTGNDQTAAGADGVVPIRLEQNVQIKAATKRSVSGVNRRDHRA